MRRVALAAVGEPGFRGLPRRTWETIAKGMQAEAQRFPAGAVQL